MLIRPEKPENSEAIRIVNTQAFGQPDEANIIAALRARDAAVLSLVAVVEDQIVGHILFSPVTIEGEHGRFQVVGLGPLAVLPAYQNQGIGSHLTRAGLAQCKEAGHPIVVVLGHPRYYPRFGFQPAVQFGVRCEYDVPDEVFMLLELEAGALNGRTGLATYPPEFG